MDIGVEDVHVDVGANRDATEHPAHTSIDARGAA